MRLATWNVNGLRAGPGPGPILAALDAHVVCLQETRLTRDQLDDSLTQVEGYTSYFSCCRTRLGYSGVATFCRAEATPEAAEEGLSGLLAGPGAMGSYVDSGSFSPEELAVLDSEGRALVTHHRIRMPWGAETMLTVLNVYCPHAGPRQPLHPVPQHRFLQLLRNRALSLLHHGGHVVIMGDLNIAHRPIDHCQPGDPEAFAANPARCWLDELLSGDGSGGPFVDTFRLRHPGQRQAFSCWRGGTGLGVRAANQGTRLDYILADRVLALGALAGASLLPSVLGSDHCPVLAQLGGAFVPAPHPPALATRRTQLSLHPFLAPRGPPTPLPSPSGARKRLAPTRLPQMGDLRQYFKVKGPSPDALGDCGEKLSRYALGQKQQEPPHDATVQSLKEMEVAQTGLEQNNQEPSQHALGKHGQGIAQHAKGSRGQMTTQHSLGLRDLRRYFKVEGGATGPSQHAVGQHRQAPSQKTLAL
ncbi:DNA-(apurinic or apyrimidinic site) endonuclease 2 isoform X1 [Alligator mississippiensis]|uniref:DNA-(apurinic or apyrimidinic site) endonuclease n=2 Tax=Alligator mississippiensis TaxID=8496 RepID=A0A151NDI5_ALLMI|nr:DNA-(apurinic or apyrimidinic site) endonuclease 2 isoform X1 [Alligator mississippiensis]KYO34858.1 DNA-(apurinic or apyrimidinic site) lyase 2 isoform A [Alligator mississippiensis]